MLFEAVRMMSDVSCATVVGSNTEISGRWKTWEFLSPLLVFCVVAERVRFTPVACLGTVVIRMIVIVM